MRPILAALILIAAAGAPGRADYGRADDGRAGDGRAEEGLYQCEVESFYRFLDAEFHPDARSDLIGERFLVDRANGTVSGFELSNEQARDRMVLDRGSNKQAFKVLSVFEVYGPYQAVKYLYVEEFAEGPAKPFFAVSGSWLLTGHCSE